MQSLVLKKRRRLFNELMGGRRRWFWILFLKNLEGEEDVLVQDVLYSSSSPFPSPLLLSDQVKGRGGVSRLG